MKTAQAIDLIARSMYMSGSGSKANSHKTAERIVIALVDQGVLTLEDASQSQPPTETFGRIMVSVQVPVVIDFPADADQRGVLWTDLYAAAEARVAQELGISPQRYAITVQRGPGSTGTFMRDQEAGKDILAAFHLKADFPEATS